MAALYPVPSTRTSTVLQQARMLRQLHSDQLSIQRLQNQISTGRRIERPSDDAPAANRALTLQRLLELKAQTQKNVETSQSYLEATDSSLGGVASLLSHVRGLAVEAASDTSSDTTRQAAAVEVREAIERLIATGNHSFRGRYIFAGSRSSEVPFSGDIAGVTYHGNEGSLDSFVDLDLPYATNASGAAVFGTFSSQVEGTVDLDPVLTAETPLSTLYGGRGVSLGSIRISDGTNNQIIDLSGAATIGDVADLIEANPPTGRTITATITATGLTIDIDDAGGGNLTITEISGGTTASDLRIFSPLGTGIAPMVGGDLDPALRLTTPLADILTAGPPLDLASGLQITNGGQTYTIDVSAAQTIEDLLNAINDSPASVLAEIADSGERLIVRSRLSGTDFSIGENGGTTATQLGIRSLTIDTAVADLNHGRGVTGTTGTDFTIRRKDGFDLAIDISSAVTIDDVLNLINNDPTNLNPLTRVEARLTAFGNGIELFDGNTAGASQLQVTEAFGSFAARDLGLVPRDATSALGVISGSGDTLTGVDVNPQEVSGVFNSLLRLHASLDDFDRAELERAVALLDEDFDRVTFARGEIGTRARTLDTIQSQVEDEDVLLRTNLSDEIDTDLTEAISTLAARQAALTASMQLAGTLFRMSLFDFL